jgi:hypothetical protein
MSKLLLAAFLAGVASGGAARAAGKSFANTMTTLPHRGNQARYVPVTSTTINQTRVGQRVIVTGSDGIRTRTGTVEARPSGGNRIQFDR